MLASPGTLELPDMWEAAGEIGLEPNLAVFRALIHQSVRTVYKAVETLHKPMLSWRFSPPGYLLQRRRRLARLQSQPLRRWVGTNEIDRRIPSCPYKPH